MHTCVLHFRYGFWLPLNGILADLILVYIPPTSNILAGYLFPFGMPTSLLIYGTVVVLSTFVRQFPAHFNVYQ